MRGTYTPGQTVVRTNKGIFFCAIGGFETPKALVQPNAVSREMYKVAMKKAPQSPQNGCPNKIRSAHDKDGGWGCTDSE